MPFRGFVGWKRDDVRRFIALKTAIRSEWRVIGKCMLLGMRYALRRNVVTPQRMLAFDSPHPEPNEPPDHPFRDSAFKQNKHDALHRWVPWIAGFSAGFVADVMQHYAPSGTSVHVLDPFAGVGTTLVEGLRRGYCVTGFEINPFAALVSRVKCSAWSIHPRELLEAILSFEETARRRVASIDAAFERGDDIARCLPEPVSRPPAAFRSRMPLFSPAVERKLLHCLDIIRELPRPDIRNMALAALGAILVQVSNYSYEPSLGSRIAAGKPNVLNADVVGLVVEKLRVMHDDSAIFREEMARWHPLPTAEVALESALHLHHVLAPESVHIVITSPPYLNNYHYIRNTRPHLLWLDLVATPADLKRLEDATFGKHWQTVRNAPPAQLEFRLPFLEDIIAAIAERNPEKGVYSGRGWANYVVAYGNDCHRLCRNLFRVLKPGAAAVVVLGNSVLQGVHVPTDQIFGEIGTLCGLQLEAIHMLRTKRVGTSIIHSSIRNGSSTPVTLYETAVVLRKPLSC